MKPRYLRKDSGSHGCRRRSNTIGGTVVRVTLLYDPPGPTIVKIIAKRFQKDPKIQARQDLRRFKQLMAFGEVSTAQPPDAAPRA